MGVSGTAPEESAEDRKEGCRKVVKRGLRASVPPAEKEGGDTAG